jgi:hypothetical protein
VALPICVRCCARRLATSSCGTARRRWCGRSSTGAMRWLTRKPAALDATARSGGACSCIGPTRLTRLHGARATVTDLQKLTGLPGGPGPTAGNPARARHRRRADGRIQVRVSDLDAEAVPLDRESTSQGLRAEQVGAGHDAWLRRAMRRMSASVQPELLRRRARLAPLRALRRRRGALHIRYR